LEEVEFVSVSDHSGMMRYYEYLMEIALLPLPMDGN
jgi:hypothetical protein